MNLLKGDSLPARRFSASFLYCITVIALWTLAVRWCAISLAPDALIDDPDAYARIATVWDSTGVYGTIHRPADHELSSETADEDSNRVIATAFRPPLYPWLIKEFALDSKHLLLKERLLIVHTILGVVTTISAAICFYIYFPTLISSGSQSLRLVGMVACGALIALDPILLRQSQLIMTETLATALTMITLLVFAFRSLDRYRCSWKSQFVWGTSLGLLFGFNALCRPTSLAWLVLCVAATIAIAGYSEMKNFLARFECDQIPSRECRIKNLRQDGTMRAVPYFARNGLRCNVLLLLLLVFASIVPLVPWGLRNQQQIGKWQWTTTHGGYTLLLANNHSIYDHFRGSWSRNWDESSFFDEWQNEQSKTANELDSDALANRLARQVIFSRPTDFLASIPARFTWLWIPWPNQGSLLSRSVIGTWYVSLYALAAIAFAYLVRKGSRMTYTLESLIPTICLFVSISLVHSVYWSNMRMRAVAMPSLAILAVLGVCCLLTSRSVSSRNSK